MSLGPGRNGILDEQITSDRTRRFDQAGVDCGFDRRHLVHGRFRRELDAARRGHARRVRVAGVDARSYRADVHCLPQRHAYDVVYRHALTLDATGDRLAFGSTTGGLWVSENQGEQWSNVTYTLPPIYAVRFA